MLRSVLLNIHHSAFRICSFLARAVLDVDVVALDHAFERLSVNAEDARGGRLVAARVREDARDVAPLDPGERGPFFPRGRQARPAGGARSLPSRGVEVVAP